MITYVTLPEATANIVQLLDRVAQGEEIIISQAGKTIAHISPPPKVLEPRSYYNWLKISGISDDKFDRR